MRVPQTTLTLERSDFLTLAEEALRRRYPGTFVSNMLGRSLIFAQALAQVAAPYLPDPLWRDARTLSHIFDEQLNSILAVCILTVDDVRDGPALGGGGPPVEITAEQHGRLWDSYFARHFSDILCETQYWHIVDALRQEVGIEADPIA